MVNSILYRRIPHKTFTGWTSFPDHVTGACILFVASRLPDSLQHTAAHIWVIGQYVSRKYTCSCITFLWLDVYHPDGKFCHSPFSTKRSFKKHICFNLWCFQPLSTSQEWSTMNQHYSIVSWEPTLVEHPHKQKVLLLWSPTCRLRFHTWPSIGRCYRVLFLLNLLLQFSLLALDVGKHWPYKSENVH